jgi:twitching motility protein PilI
MSELSPFEMLSSLGDKARLSAIDLPSAQAIQTHSTGLGYNLLGQRFVTSMKEVSELMRVPTATRVPSVKNFVIGIGNVRGRLMILVDLVLFFGEPSKFSRAQRIVLAVDGEEYLLGFIIDDSFGMQHFPSDAYSEKAGDVPEMFEIFVQGSYEVMGVQWLVMSPQRFLMTQG